MAKATIKSKTGALITVEGSESEVAHIISNFEKTSVVGQVKQAMARTRAEKTGAKKREGAAELIIAMREGGFFQKPKELGEVADALEEKGFLYPVTTLSGVMLGLVKRRELRRKRQDGRWVYGR